VVQPKAICLIISLRRTSTVTRVVRTRFPPEQWNVHQQTVDDDARTNNYAEAWNRRFESLVANGHPSTLIRGTHLSVSQAFLLVQSVLPDKYNI